MMEQINKVKQSIWLDNIRRDFLEEGTLSAMVNKMNVRGLTSNPTIFEKAIVKTSFYDEAIKKLSQFNISAEEIFENLMAGDIQKAADILRPVYDESGKTDGYVSMEISPKYARSYSKTVSEAAAAFERLKRPNVMIKVPATDEGVKAIKNLTAGGVNVNATLIFSPDRYRQVLNAYFEGLSERKEKNGDLSAVASVASFFVSRIDTAADRELDRIWRKSKNPRVKNFMGKTAVANCLAAYRVYSDFFKSEKWSELEKAGARPQRILWASTSVKNQDYRDTLYADELALEQSVNTLSEEAIKAFLDHGKINAEPVEKRIAAAEKHLFRLKKIGLDLPGILEALENEGIKKFVDSYNGVVKHILIKSQAMSEKKFFRFSGENINRIDFSEKLDKIGFVRRLWEKDPLLWKEEESHKKEIVNRLGWLDSPFFMREKIKEIANFAKHAKKKFSHAVLLGMGGSSLAPKVLASVFQKPENPRLIILDTTDPRQVKRVAQTVNLAKTLFIYSSKSGGTIEPKSQYKYFRSLLEKKGMRSPGNNFIAITDPGTPLEKIASDEGFAKVFLNPTDIGGRFSIFSYFGLVPAAVCGADLEKLVESAVKTARACKNEKVRENPGAFFGALIGGAHRLGLDKLTLVTGRKIKSFELWAEQLVAESLGKENKGVVPVCGEKISGGKTYQSDRFFASITMGRQDKKTSQILMNLARLGHPVLEMELDGLSEMGGEFFKWEIATAAAGAIMGINPFDQPDVQEAKTLAMKQLETIKTQGLKLPVPSYENGRLSAFLSRQMRKFVPRAAAVMDIFNSVFNALGGKEYIALLPYLPYDAQLDRDLARLRETLNAKFSSATLFGYGPRYLHSSGQLHKGGSNNAVFIIVTASPRPDEDLEVPGEGYTLGQLEMAQAHGDFEALDSRNRRVIWIDLKKPFKKNVKYLYTIMRDINKYNAQVNGGGSMMKVAVRKRKTSPAKTGKTTTSKTSDYVVIDYPKNLETVSSRHYTFRIGSTCCPTMEISINGQAWQPCRWSAGYWWCDWNGYTPGNYKMVARMTTSDGKYLISKIRRFKVSY